jgi:uncharacterized protein (TIGR03435 family)
MGGSLSRKARDDHPRRFASQWGTRFRIRTCLRGAHDDFLLRCLAATLHMPVVNQTGITGSWDFHVDSVDPDNHDIPTAVYGVIDRLGLKIKRSRGPIQTLVIDHIDHPTLD